MSDQAIDRMAASLPFVEELYLDYLEDPQSVSEDWQTYFKSLNGSAGSVEALARRTQLFSTEPTGPVVAGQAPEASGDVAKYWELAALQHQVDRLTRNYRARGHREAELDPLKLRCDVMSELRPDFHGLKDEHMDLVFNTQAGRFPLRDIIARLRQTYCRYIGVQFMHIDSLHVREWLQDRMESTQNSIELSRAEQLRILTKLTDAVMFEEFIQNKYIGAKSFSLEGGESLIPLLDLAIERAGAHGVKEIVIGMAHRGRLNVLANIMGKSPRQIFREFEDMDPELHVGGGDVKYHLGYHNDWQTVGGQSVHIALCFNPSHLEYVNPVAMGRMRGMMDRIGDTEHEEGLVILIHGDAAFAGEGIVPETMNLSELKAYTTGGTLHVVVNNQIGFTTNPSDSRSGGYATSMARVLQIPIFHVNGENPEAVAQTVRLAQEFRAEFKRDVVIDMYCYRRRGHNEGDEPSFTQPQMYKAIKRRRPVRESYLKNMLKLGAVTKEEADEIATNRRKHLEDELSVVRRDEVHSKSNTPSLLGKVWKEYLGGPESEIPEVPTGVSMEELHYLGERITTVPEGFNLHPKLKRQIDNRAAMGRGEKELDWAMAEALAFASIGNAGHRIRFSGQDVQRGTFSQRHTVWHDFETGAEYSIFSNLSENQGPVELYNSALSESGVLGFEYGYSLAYPDGLVIWEAQFGDFANVAQPIIDQFISSAEDKWRSLSGLIMLLPHGFEGMGPEHSSARLERFLSLAAEDNMQIAYPTTPAQYFHLLRRQVVRPWRKPLVVMTPKSLLRLPACTSPLEDLSTSRFHRTIADELVKPDECKRVLLCTGKIYYDLLKAREERKLTNVAIVRVEQLYPMAEEVIYAALAPYGKDCNVYWVQEEPENMGAWRRIRGKFCERMQGRTPMHGCYRPASASPATGSASSHKIEQQEILDEAFAGL